MNNEIPWYVVIIGATFLLIIHIWRSLHDDQSGPSNELIPAGVDGLSHDSGYSHSIKTYSRPANTPGDDESQRSNKRGERGDRNKGSNDPLTHAIVMRVIISLAILISSLYIILSQNYPDADQKWAYSSIGALVMFWLSGAGRK